MTGSRKMIVVVNGHPRAGKDTVVDRLSSALTMFGWSTSAISSIDPIRNVLRDLGIPVDNKTPAERALMADVKAALESYDHWATRACITAAMSALAKAPSKKAVVFLHVREPEAIAFCKSLLPSEVEFLTVFVDRQTAERVSSNDADAQVELYAYDFHVDNNGSLGALAANARAIATQLNQSTAKELCA